MRYLFLAMILAACLVVGMFGFRGHKFSDTPVELFPDMDRQGRVNAQSKSAFFADGAGSRIPVAGVLPMGFSIPENPVEDGDPILDGFTLPGSYFNSGRIGEYYGDGMPEELQVDQALLARGRARFGIYCAICHGASGDGEGTLANFGNMRPIANLHMPQFSDPANPQYRPDGELFEVITIGRARMGAYGSAIPAADRWAIIAYVRALQDAVKKAAAASAGGKEKNTENPEPAVDAPATSQ
ncbi:MAG: cytochrome c [Verrucomicrobiaceae bacterium]|nr:cytochrome c [Verrucomicrobiaceae bacterium]